MMNITCPVMPDAQELRMLRALVVEGVASTRYGPYLALFHGWRVRVVRDAGGGDCAVSVTVEIRCRHGGLSGRTCRFVNRCFDEEAQQ